MGGETGCGRDYNRVHSAWQKPGMICGASLGAAAAEFRRFNAQRPTPNAQLSKSELFSWELGVGSWAFAPQAL